MTQETQNPFADAEVISIYTRAQALADGLLVDVTDHARAHLFQHPVAFTRNCYTQVIAEWCRYMERAEEDRLHDILDRLAETARVTPPPRDRIRLAIGTRDGEGVAYLVELIAHCGPGDDLEPVITVMLPEDE